MKTRHLSVNRSCIVIVTVLSALSQESGMEGADSSRTLGCSPVESRLVAPVDVSLVGVALLLQQNLLHTVHVARCCCLVKLGHVACSCHGNAWATQGGTRPEPGAVHAGVDLRVRTSVRSSAYL